MTRRPALRPAIPGETPPSTAWNHVSKYVARRTARKHTFYIAEGLLNPLGGNTLARR
ncbi:hypothetical protein GCM10020358_69560 [Amorphoplanes nipponensis]